MKLKTNFDYYDFGKKETVVLTTGLLGNIEKSKSLVPIINFFKDKELTILAFDMYGHGKSDGNIEDFTLSKVYEQLKEIEDFLKIKQKEIKILYGVSASALPMIKYGIENKIEKIILRSPAIEMYAKRNRELGLEKMLEWKKKGKIELWNDYETGKPVYFKYKFILDVLENFHGISFDNYFTKILIGSGKEDIEVPFFELNILAKKYKNIKVIGYKNEKHSFSNEGLKKTINDIELFLLKNIEN